MARIKRQSERKQALRNKLTIFFVIVIILFSGYFAKNQIARLAHIILFPLQEVFTFVKKPFQNIPIYFSSKTLLKDQNYELSEKNKKLEIELLSIKSIKEQNAELKKILEFRNQGGESRLVGQIILIPPFSPFDTFVIRLNPVYMDSLEDSSALIGNQVYIMNVLVGEIVEIYNKNAIAKLYSSYGEKMAIKINNEIVAGAEGMGGLSFKSSIPKNVFIEEGMPIFPIEHPEIIVGTISNIQTSESSSFQTIYFQYPFNYSDFNFVEIAL